MELAICGRCKQPFVRFSSPVCQSCQLEDELEYERVRAAMRKAPDLTAEGLAQAAEVELATVLRFVREGRIISMQLLEGYTCGRCGSPAISPSIRLCHACLAQLDRECAEQIRDLKARLSTAVPLGVVTDMRHMLSEKRRVEPDPEKRVGAAPPSDGKGRMAIAERISPWRRKVS